MLKKKHRNLVLSDRDIDLLRGLFECRVMAARHVVALYFRGRAEMAKKRLQRLKTARLVTARARSRFSPASIFLTLHGIRTLASRGILREYATAYGPSLDKRTRVSDRTLEHELEVMDVKACIHHAATDSSVEVLACSTWPALHKFHTARGEVKPDAFLRIRARGSPATPTVFYLELDRSTESIGVLLEQARKYRACRKARSRMAPQTWNEALGEHRFTVLYVLRSEARLRSFAQRLLLETPPIRSLVWLTTLETITKEPFGRIWVRPRDLASDPRVRLSLVDEDHRGAGKPQAA